MGLGIFGLETDGFTYFRDGVGKLPLLPKSGAEVGVGLGIVWFEADGFAVLGDRLGDLCWRKRATPRLEWASA